MENLLLHCKIQNSLAVGGGSNLETKLKNSLNVSLGWIFFNKKKTTSAKLVVVRCVRRDGLLFGVHNGRHEMKPGDLGVVFAVNERFGTFWERLISGKGEATKRSMFVVFIAPFFGA